MWKSLSFAIGFGLIIMSGAAADTLPGDPMFGHKLAKEVCSECHSVEKGMRRHGKLEPPAFQDLADNPTMTPLALRFLLQKPHERMPDLILSKDETDDVIAYIWGLRK